MKTILLKFTLIFTFFLFTVSCSNLPPISKKAYIRNFTSFVNNVEDNYYKYTQEDWEKADLRYASFTGQYFNKFEPKLTEEETRMINLLKGKYLGLKIKGKSKKVIEDVISTIKNTANEAEGLIETLLHNNPN